MSGMDNDGRFAPPRAVVEDVVEPSDQPVLAGRGRRFCAVVIDVLFAMALMWVVSKVLPWDPFADKGLGVWDFNPIDAIGNFLCYFVLNGYLLTTRGQTLGKALLKIRVVRRDGSLPSFMRIICIREGVSSLISVVYAAGLIFTLVDGLFIFTPSRRCIHDHLADTIVVNA